MSDVLSAFEREFALKDLQWQIYSAFIKLAFSHGHKTVGDIAVHVAGRVDRNVKSVRRIIDKPHVWTLSDVSDFFLAYGVTVRLSLVERDDPALIASRMGA